MVDSRLSQIAIGERAYETGDVSLTTSFWGWQAFPVAVEYASQPVSRLGHMAIGVAAYVEDTGTPVQVGIGVGNWGWTAYPVDLPAQNVAIQTADWGWQANDVKLCSQYAVGYAGSFNSNVWPTCVWNDYVFGPRMANEFSLPTEFWGWTANPVLVDFKDPIDVDLTRGDWGWTGVPVGVSFAFEIQTTIGSYGWTAYPVSVTLPYAIDATVQDWGWRAYPLAVSFENDVQITVGTWGWQAFAVQVDAPIFDIFLRIGNWGWDSYAVEVRQTTLLPGDIAAIADAVYAKLTAEGAVQQWLETWQRKGMDPTHPQTIRHPKNGGAIEVAGITIEQTETDGDVTQHRQ